MFSLSDGGSQQTYYRILYTCWFLYKHETEKKSGLEIWRCIYRENHGPHFKFKE